MKKFKVIQNGIETNSWMESPEMGADYYEPCFGKPDRWLKVEDFDGESEEDAEDVRESELSGESVTEYFFSKTYIVAEEEVEDPAWAVIRAERNSLLASSDKFLISDYPISSETRAAWIVYRQALRDITEVASPSDVIWPVAPS